MSNEPVDDDFTMAEENSSDTSYGMESSSLLKENIKSTKEEEPNENEESETDKSEMWRCRICFEDLNEPVVTQCGHIYCWNCIYTWYSTKNPSNFIQTFRFGYS